MLINSEDTENNSFFRSLLSISSARIIWESSSYSHIDRAIIIFFVSIKFQIHIYNQHVFMLLLFLLSTNQAEKLQEFLIVSLSFLREIERKKSLFMF